MYIDVFGFTGLSPHPITDLRVMMPAAFASLCHPKGQVLLLAVLLLLAIYQFVYGGNDVRTLSGSKVFVLFYVPLDPQHSLWHW